MNLPNKLTVLRVLLIPFFLFFFFATFVPYNYLIAFIIFSVASLTDLADGKIARKQGLVTDFGKLMDPLADKLLVLAAVIVVLAPGGYLSPPFALGTAQILSWVSLFIVLGRDLVVNAIRLVAASGGVVIAADIYGKLKTVFQMVWLSVVLLTFSLRLDFGLEGVFALNALDMVGYLLFALMMLFTILSGANYVLKNKTMFADA